MTEKVFLNKGLVDIDKASLSVTDGGLLYGAGLFETMRSYNEKVFALDKHLERLISSAEKIGLVHSFSKDFLSDAVYKTIQANELDNARIRLTMTCGPMTTDIEKTAPKLLVTATEMLGYPEEYYRTGVLAVLCPFRQNPTDPLCGHKSLNYYSRMLALKLAKQKQAAEALWFTTDNRLAEGCISNIFLVKNSVLYTPKTDTPVLPGVTRKLVLDIATEMSLKFEEKDLTIDDLLGADEIFMTNSIMEILPTTQLEKHKVGSGKIGTVTQKLLEGYKELVKNECGEQK
jgi:branched-chain amino acid aminotransferase